MKIEIVAAIFSATALALSVVNLVRANRLQAAQALAEEIYEAIEAVKRPGTGMPDPIPQAVSVFAESSEPAPPPEEQLPLVGPSGYVFLGRPHKEWPHPLKEPHDGT